MGGPMMTLTFIRSLSISLLLGTVLVSPVWAQTNMSKPPVLPPPPTETLQPIATTEKPADTAKPAPPPVAAETSATAMGQSENSANPPATPTETAAAPPPAPAQPVPVAAAAPTLDTIALPGMPSSEAALNGNPNANTAATTLDPSLVGATAAPAFDPVAYEQELKERLAKIKTETREQALQQARENMFPLKPEEIKDLIRQLRITQAAIQKPVDPIPPTPRAVVYTMALDPGAQPPTVKLLNGNVTSLSILDASGQPWPIVDIAYGGAFDVKPPESGGHIIRISPLKEYARGNMSIRLQKLATPLTFTLESGGKEVHYRFDARVPQLGPNAKTSLIDRGIMLTAGEDASLSSILVGTPPPSAERLKVSGVDGRTSAFRLNGSTYVRTPHTLLSPTWDSSVSSADGTNVYRLPDVPVLLLSDDGVMVRAHIEQPAVDPFGLPDSQKPVPATAATVLPTGDRG